MFGLIGGLMGLTPPLLGILLAFCKLHLVQAATTFSQFVLPPLERGITWSNVNSLATKGLLQYWQQNPSRRKTLKRVNAGLRD